MRTPWLRWCIPALALTLVTLAACDDDAATTATSTTAPATTTTGNGAATIVVTVGVDSSPTRVEKVKVGQPIILTITDPSKDDEFHVHGVDLGDGEHVAAGTQKVFQFTLTSPQTIEVESHATEEVLLQIEADA
jgi:hypothetical protein